MSTARTSSPVSADASSLARDAPDRPPLDLRDGGVDVGVVRIREQDRVAHDGSGGFTPNWLAASPDFAPQSRRASEDRTASPRSRRRPSCNASRLSCHSSNAVTMMMRIDRPSVGCCFITRHTSQPSRPGIITSSSTTAGRTRLVQRQRFVAAVRHGHGVSSNLEILPDDLRVVVIVVDDQDRWVLSNVHDARRPPVRRTRAPRARRRTGAKHTPHMRLPRPTAFRMRTRSPRRTPHRWVRRSPAGGFLQTRGRQSGRSMAINRRRCQAPHERDSRCSFHPHNTQTWEIA